MDTAKPLAQRARLRVHHGTSEVLARANLLDREELAPGGECFCQLELESPLPPLVGDRLIFRSYSPMITIGGGTVLDIAPPRHKRYRPEVIEALEARTKGSGSDLLADLLLKEAKPFNLSAARQIGASPQRGDRNDAG